MPQSKTFQYTFKKKKKISTSSVLKMLATALIQISDQQIAVVILAVLPSLVEIQCSCMAHCCCENSDCRVTFFFFVHCPVYQKAHRRKFFVCFSALSFLLCPLWKSYLYVNSFPIFSWNWFTALSNNLVLLFLCSPLPFPASFALKAPICHEVLDDPMWT